MLYQLSHYRSLVVPLPRPGCGGAESQIRTGDTVIFSHVLYQLSYLGIRFDLFRAPGENMIGSSGGFAA